MRKLLLISAFVLFFIFSVVNAGSSSSLDVHGLQLVTTENFTSSEHGSSYIPREA